MGLMQTSWVATIRSSETQLPLYQCSTDVPMRGVQVDSAGQRESEAPFFSCPKPGPGSPLPAPVSFTPNSVILSAPAPF